ncbi:MAG: GNAT family N-acetyltransferase [Rhizobiaceae bacterium]|nr:GNAT family N-acetyltransferase [Rhizobiaceae bacterium]
MPAGYSIRPRRQDDDPALVLVENRAAALFRAHGYPEVSDNPIPDVAFLARLFAGQQVWVAADGADRPVGFAVAGPLAGFLHLRELSVDPAHGRRGIGRALVGAVLAAARAAGLAGVSLTTFRDVPFNQPFYARLGFAERHPGDAPDALCRQLAAEVPDGVDPARRLLMVRAC